MKRRYLIGIIGVLILLLAGVGLYRWLRPRQGPGLPVTACVPPGAVYVVETGDARSAWQKIHRHPLFEAFRQMPDYAFLNEVDSILTAYVLHNKTTSGFFRHRPFALSAHLVAGNDYDFLYMLDLGKVYPLSRLLPVVKPLLPRSIAIRPFRIEGREAWKITGWTDDPLYVTNRGNVLLLSFSYQIIRQSLLAETNYRLDSLMRTVDGRAPFRFYFDYGQLPRFVQAFGMRPQTTVYTLARQWDKSILGIRPGPPRAVAEGITQARPGSVMAALLADNPARASRAAAVLPASTMVYTALTVKDFSRFYTDLLRQLSQSDPDQVSSYFRYAQQLEKYFQINVERDILAWMGPEIGVAKWGDAQTLTAALIIRTNDADLARRRLDEINRKLEKRSPVHFKSFRYEGHTIHYLHQKNFFRLLFGPWLGAITTPYYTVLEDYVIFSNSARDLEQLIDAYLQGNTLEKTATAGPFLDEGPRRSHLHVFIRPPALYSWTYRHGTASQRQSLRAYYPLFQRIRMMRMDWNVRDSLSIDTYMALQLEKHH